MPLATDLAELKRSGYLSRSVREELRQNLLQSLSAKRNPFEGIIGYEHSVIPEIENAILAGHHMILLGERGQAKTRLARALVGLLDERVPVVSGCEVNDDPLRLVCAQCRRRYAEMGDSLPVKWIGRETRYGEKLATPDVTMADLFGEIDPVKIAEGRYMSDEEALHFGVLPRTNRGVFAINELPDLAEKIQVGLFNVMEERDLQFKGYKIRLPMDIVVVATANPEDYTNRGRIVTPLKDRFGARIRTHYPKKLEHEIAIMDQEVSVTPRGGRPVRVAGFVKDIIARLSMAARNADEVAQSSGVSVRVSIDNYETVIANAEKRAVRCEESEIVPRMSDLHALHASTAGKLEFEYGIDDDMELRIIDRLVSGATKTVFDERVDLAGLQPLVDYVGAGWGISVSDTMPSSEYLAGIESISGFRRLLESLGPYESPGLMAAIAEFVLEGLHLHELLNREREGGHWCYRC